MTALCEDGCRYAKDIGMPEHHCGDGCMYEKSILDLAAIDAYLVALWRRATLADVIEDLKGQCVFDLEYFCEERLLGELTTNELNVVDNEVFCCEGCGWWCSIDEMAVNASEGLYCDDCVEELED